MGNRKAATALLLKYIGKIDSSGENLKLYQTRLAAMKDSEFEDLISKVEAGTFIFPIIAPNLGKVKIDVSKNVKLARELGYEFFQRLWLTDRASGIKYLTPVKYMVLDLPFRRQAERLDKKRVIPENNLTKDNLTGQAIGPSRGSGLSFPELQVLFAMGLESTITEFTKARGGDTIAFSAMNQAIVQNGESSLADLEALGSRAKSSDTLGIILKGMHLDNNI